VTDQTAPSTTVVIPVWDHYVELRFEQALASVTSQDVPVTVIVVDNASRAALPQLPGVVVLRTPTRVSLGAARNLGLAHVETDTVMFADADDLILPGTIRRLQAQLRSAPAMVAVAAAFVDAASGKRHRWPRPWIARLARFPTLMALVNAAWAIYPITGPVLVRTAVAREVGGHGDVDNGDARCLGAALLFRGPVGWSEEPGCVYHQRSGSNLDRFNSPRGILESSRSVRARLASDFGGPAWLSAALPLIAVTQWCAIAAHVLVAALRRAAASRAAGAEP
jgi:hypothetical protein